MEASGALLVTDGVRKVVGRVDPSGQVITIAGSPGSCGSLDGVGTAARFADPGAIAVDPTGTIFVTDAVVVRRIDPSLVVTTLAGRNAAAREGRCESPLFAQPVAVMSGVDGALYVTGSNHTVSRVAPDGTISLVAGAAGEAGSADGTGAEARFRNPAGLTLDASGAIYVADTGNHTVRRISPAGEVSTVAGVPGQQGASDGPLADARFASPTDVAVDANGTIYIADQGNGVVRVITPSGQVTTLAGSAGRVEHLALDVDGVLYVAGAQDYGSSTWGWIRKVTVAGAITAVTANGCVWGDDPKVCSPNGLAVASDGGLLVSDDVWGLLHVTPTGTVTHVAGAIPWRSYIITGPNSGWRRSLAGSDDGVGAKAEFCGAVDVAVDSAGRAFVADSCNSAIRMVTPSPPSAPVIDDVSIEADPGAPASRLVVRGAHFFATGFTLQVGGRPAVQVRLLAPDTIAAVMPAGLTGPPSVTVTALGGTATLLPPTLAAITPANVPVVGGLSITLEGTGFVAGSTRVTLGGVQADLVVLDETRLVATVPPGVSGPVTVTVSTPDGSYSRLGALTYVPGLTVRGAGTGTGTVISAEGFECLLVGGASLGPDCQIGVAEHGTTELRARAERGSVFAGWAGACSGSAACLVDGSDREVTATFTSDGFTLYFAEGVASSLFSTTWTLLNPTDTPAHPVLHLFGPDGPLGSSPVLPVVPAHGVVRLDAPVDLPVTAFGSTVHAEVPLVTERTVTWDTTRYGAHTTSGVRAPGETWYFAEGATHSGFQLFYLLLNPDPFREALVDVTYLRQAPAPPLVRSYRVPPAARTTVWANHDAAPLPPGDVGAIFRVTNAVPIVVERAMYRDAGQQVYAAGHAAEGATSPALTWWFAEGAVGSFFTTYLLLVNPNDAVAEVEARYRLGTGATVRVPYAVAPLSRLTIWVDEVAEGATTEVATRLRVLNDVPIVAERVMWWPGDSPATWTESHVSLGAPEPGTQWMLADGAADETRGLATYVLVANASDLPGQVRVSIAYDDGTQTSREFPLPPGGRLSVPIGIDLPAADGRQFAITVESIGPLRTPIVVERAMYWDASSAPGLPSSPWAAGTCTVATRLR